MWIGFIVAPELALSTILNSNAPIEWELQGIWPSISSNGVGTLGVVVTFWSLARLRTLPSPTTLRRAFAYAMAGLGVASLIFAQYRTGYVAFVAGLLVYLLVGRRWALATIVLLAVLGVVARGPASLVQEAEPYALRGQTTEEASELSSRVDFWAAAIPVWEEVAADREGTADGDALRGPGTSGDHVHLRDPQHLGRSARWNRPDRPFAAEPLLPDHLQARVRQGAVGAETWSRCSCWPSWRSAPSPGTRSRPSAIRRSSTSGWPSPSRMKESGGTRTRRILGEPDPRCASSSSIRGTSREHASGENRVVDDEARLLTDGGHRWTCGTQHRTALMDFV